MRIFSFLIFILLISLLHNIHANTVDLKIDHLKKERLIIIPIGGGCMPTLHLLDHKLRKTSLPLDWVVTHDFNTLYNLIQNDFADLSNFSYFTIAANKSTKILMHTKYNLQMPHVLDTQEWYNAEHSILPIDGDLSKILEIQDTINRRIERFYAIMQLGIPIFFLRHGYIDQQQAYILYELLHSKFPLTDLTLVCLTIFQTEENTWKSRNNHIIHMYLNPEYDLNQRLHGEQHPAYTKIFQDLGFMEHEDNQKDEPTAFSSSEQSLFTLKEPQAIKK